MGFVYKITNTVNDKVYIGQTIKTLSHRFAQHIHNASRETSYYDCRLRKAIRKYGADKFSIELVEECDDSVLDERELFWIKQFNSYKAGYNSTDTMGSPRRGIHLSAEHRQRLREAHKHRDPSTYLGGARTADAKEKAVAKFKATYWNTPEEVRKERTRRAKENRRPVRYWEGKSIPQDMRDRISATLKEKHLCPPHALKVYCEETDSVYRSLTEAEKETGIDRHIIRRYIDGKRKDEKYHFRFVPKEETNG